MMKTSRQWFGIGLIILGVLFLADALRVVDFRDIFRSYWPVLIILWGLLVLFRRTPARERHFAAGGNANVMGDVDVSSGEDALNHSNVFGDVRLRVTSQSFRGGTVSTVFGDSFIDLSGAGWADGEQVLKISGVFGDCTLRLPKGSPASVSAHTVFGSVSVPDQKREGVSSTVGYESPGYAAGRTKLKIAMSQVFGDVRVEE